MTDANTLNHLEVPSLWRCPFSVGALLMVMLWIRLAVSGDRRTKRLSSTCPDGDGRINACSATYFKLSIAVVASRCCYPYFGLVRHCFFRCERQLLQQQASINLNGNNNEWSTSHATGGDRRRKRSHSSSSSDISLRSRFHNIFFEVRNAPRHVCNRKPR
jgi:hypothetical protein